MNECERKKREEQCQRLIEEELSRRKPISSIAIGEHKNIGEQVQCKPINDCTGGNTFYGLTDIVTNADLESVKFSTEKQSCLMHRKQILRKDIDLIQKNKMKEMDELVDLELRKNEYEQQLEYSLLEIKEMSELIKKLNIDTITEYKQIEAEKTIDNNIHKLKYEKDLPNLDWLKLTDTKNNGGQNERKPKKKPSVTAYKKYTSGDIFAALEEVKKGKSALQVSKQFNIPSRTLYYRAKKMGITLSRNMGEKSVAKNSNTTYFYPKHSMSQLLDRNELGIGVKQEIKTGQGSFFNLQKILVNNACESDWTFLL